MTRYEKVAMSGNPPVIVILASTLIILVISLLREDPLPTGILDGRVFFENIRIMCLFL
jgi:hypothetical protein